MGNVLRTSKWNDTKYNKTEEMKMIFWGEENGNDKGEF